MTAEVETALVLGATSDIGRTSRALPGPEKITVLADGGIFRVNKSVARSMIACGDMVI